MISEPISCCAVKPREPALQGGFALLVFVMLLGILGSVTLLTFQQKEVRESRALWEFRVTLQQRWAESGLVQYTSRRLRDLTPAATHALTTTSGVWSSELSALRVGSGGANVVFSDMVVGSFPRLTWEHPEMGNGDAGLRFRLGWNSNLVLVDPVSGLMEMRLVPGDPLLLEGDGRMPVLESYGSWGPSLRLEWLLEEGGRVSLSRLERAP